MFLECINYRFFLQVIEEPMRRDAILYLVLINRQGLIRNLKLEDSFGCSDHEMVEFKILRASKRMCSKVAALDFHFFRVEG